MERRNAWKQYDETEIKSLEAFCEEYKRFLDAGKTERECVAECVRIAKARGWKNLFDCERLVPGDRVYVDWMHKCFVQFIVGARPLQDGMRILGAHIDSPRLDIKQNPLYEDADLAYLDTHYYGGVKKYQWVARALALHGVIVKKDGGTIDVCVGEDESDPVFCISDLLPHLAQEQMKREASKIIEGEELDIIIGGRPLAGEEKDAVRANAMRLISEKYGIDEEDLLSAELEVVPAGKARDMGFDRSMILGYGHDDRVCAYPSMRAVLDFEGTPEYTSCCILTDKEEIGSYGATGMGSHYFENLVAELCARVGEYSDLTLRRAIANSRMLSSDVSAGFDPTFASAFEKKNAAYVGRGLCFNKFTGARGKSGASDANAEYVAYVRRVLDDANVSYQFAEMGRVDLGGGGTIAHTCAKYAMNVIDAGVAVLSMHAPAEIISKADIYEAYKGYCAFLKV